MPGELSTAELLDVIGTLADGLAHAEQELEAVIEHPLPQDAAADKVYEEHAKLKAAMLAAPEEWKPRLRDLYKGARGAAAPDVRGHVSDEVKRELAACNELLRRAGLLDRRVHDALEPLEPQFDGLVG